MIKKVFQGVRKLTKEKEGRALSNENGKSAEDVVSYLKSLEKEDSVVKFIPDNTIQEIAITLRKSHEDKEKMSSESKYSAIVIWNEIFGNEELFKTDHEALNALSYCLYFAIFNYLTKNNYSATALEAGVVYDALFDELKRNGYEFIDEMLPGFRDAQFMKVTKMENIKK